MEKIVLQFSKEYRQEYSLKPVVSVTKCVKKHAILIPAYALYYPLIQNEDLLKKVVKDLQEDVKNAEAKYQVLKTHAEQKLNE